MTTRRELARSLLPGALGSALARAAVAQDRVGLPDTSNLFAMDQSAARPVRLPPKPGATPSMSPADRDALERRLRCHCGCTLDVFTCRTTDFSCQVSPAMHRDVMALVAGGHTADEILEAFVNVYGERVLMAPPWTGFNRAAYLLPGIVIAAGAVAIAIQLRTWRRATSRGSGAVLPANAQPTADELRQLDAAVRDDS